MGAQVGGSFILRLIEYGCPQHAIVILHISRFPKTRTCYCGLQEATTIPHGSDPSNMRKFEVEGQPSKWHCILVSFWYLFSIFFVFLSVWYFFCILLVFFGCAVVWLGGSDIYLVFLEFSWYYFCIFCIYLVFLDFLVFFSMSCHDCIWHRSWGHGWDRSTDTGGNTKAIRPLTSQNGYTRVSRARFPTRAPWGFNEANLVFSHVFHWFGYHHCSWSCPHRPLMICCCGAAGQDLRLILPLWLETSHSKDPGSM